MIDVAQYFPLPLMRPSQKRALEFIRDSWLNGKRTILLDLPTGVGKSPIAIAAAALDAAMPVDLPDYAPGSYIVTTQKILQAQYMHDFGDRVANVMSKSNYACTAMDGTCQDGHRIAKAIKDIHKKHGDEDAEAGQWRNIEAMLEITSKGPIRDFLEEAKSRCQDSILPCGDKEMCPYSMAFAKWRNAPVSLTNAAFFFNASRMVRLVRPRSLLIIDEAHLLEDELVRHLEVHLDKKWLNEILPELEVPSFEDVLSMVLWARETLVPILSAFVDNDDESRITDPKIKRNLARAEHLKKKVDELIYMILNQQAAPGASQQAPEGPSSRECADMWVLVHDEHKNPSLRPLGLAPFGPTIASSMGYRQIFMSGTILDPGEFCDVLGLDEDAVAYYGESSPFPQDNRPVVVRGCGSMAMKSIAVTRPKVIQAIDDLLQYHHDEKGIIHAGTYALAGEIRKSIKSPRLLFHDDAAGRTEALNEHSSGKGPTVLVSPSMTTGIDLKDDLARWCVVCKVPWPFLGDRRIDMLRQKRPSWYAWKTVQGIMQACGRVVRSQDDCAVVYILDDDFDRLYRDYGHMFPEWWKKALFRSA